MVACQKVYSERNSAKKNATDRVSITRLREIQIFFFFFFFLEKTVFLVTCAKEKKKKNLNERVASADLDQWRRMHTVVVEQHLRAAAAAVVAIVEHIGE